MPGGYKEVERGSFGGGGVGGSSPWNEVVGTPATWNHTELVHAVLRNNETLVDWLQQVRQLELFLDTVFSVFSAPHPPPSFFSDPKQKGR